MLEFALKITVVNSQSLCHMAEIGNNGREL
jgi:hypothetical protein